MVLIWCGFLFSWLLIPYEFSHLGIPLTNTFTLYITEIALVVSSPWWISPLFRSTPSSREYPLFRAYFLIGSVYVLYGLSTYGTLAVRQGGLVLYSLYFLVGIWGIQFFLKRPRLGHILREIYLWVATLASAMSISLVINNRPTLIHAMYAGVALILALNRPRIFGRDGLRALVLATYLFAAGSRGAMLGLGVALLAIALGRKDRGKYQFLIVLLGLGIAQIIHQDKIARFLDISYLIYFLKFHQFTVGKPLVLSTEADNNALWRLYLWKDALVELWNHRTLFFGVGIGPPLSSPTVESAFHSGINVDMHNSWLAIVYRFGAFGAVPIFFLVTSIFRKLWAQRRESYVILALFCYTVILAGLNVVLEGPYLSPMVWFTAAVGLVLCSKKVSMT